MVKKDPGEVYRQIKSKHLMFSETAEEKEIRVLEEGDALQKGKLSTFQWEVRWESHLHIETALGLNAKEALTQCLKGRLGPLRRKNTSLRGLIKLPGRKTRWRGLMQRKNAFAICPHLPAILNSSPSKPVHARFVPVL